MKILTDKLEFGTELMYQGNYRLCTTSIHITLSSQTLLGLKHGIKEPHYYFLMKEYQKSLSDIEKGIKLLEPRHFGALSGRAQIFFVFKDYQKAINRFKKS